MRLLVVGVLVLLAVSTGIVVDRVANKAPVTLSNIQWKANERSCTVTFRAQSHALTPRSAAVFITLRHSSDEDVGEEETGSLICGSTVVPLRLQPLESRTVTVEVPTSRRAVECDMVIEESKVTP